MVNYNKQEIKKSIMYLRLTAILGFLFFYWIGFFLGKYTNFLAGIIWSILFMILPVFVGLWLTKKKGLVI